MYNNLINEKVKYTTPSVNIGYTPTKEEKTKIVGDLKKKIKELSKKDKINFSKIIKSKTHLKINKNPISYKSQVRRGNIPSSTIKRIEQNMPNNILSRPSDNYNLLRQKKLFTRGD